MPYTSFLGDVEAQMNRARDAGLIAAAQVALNRVKEKLAGGYTTGDFVSGASVNHATRTEPKDENGVRVIRIGTDLGYNAAWEHGHENLFTRKFERVEKWVPALFETAQEQADAFGRVFARFMATQRASEAAD